LNKFEKFVGNCEAQIEAHGRHQKKSDVIGVGRYHQLRESQGREHADIRAFFAHRSELVDITLIVRLENEIEAEALWKAVHHSDHVLQATRATGQAVMNHPEAVRINRLRFAGHRDRQAGKHLAMDAELPGVLGCEALRNSHDVVGPRQVLPAERDIQRLVE